jgi:alcohol dehydrogenase
MRAVQIRQYGSIQDTVRLAEIAIPTPGANEVLVEVHAAGLNPIDYKRITGEVKLLFPLALPATVGHELSGVVVECGKNVKRFSVGDEVYCAVDLRKNPGAFADFCVVKEEQLAWKPRNLSHAEAVAIPLAGLTALQVLRDIFKIQAGNTVLIQAGAGGVGTLAIQLAKYAQAVVATTASAPKHELVKSLGADVIVDYTKDNFRSIIKDYDFVFDTLGGSSMLDSFYCLRRGGTLATVSGTPDKFFGREYGVNPLVRAALWALNRSVYTVARETETTYRFWLKKSRGEDLHFLAGLVENNHLRPVLDRSYSLEESRDALEYLQTGRATGKIALKLK